ncbi:hypothetical protein TKK_0005524 [Trichogramma kaykai]
MIKYITFVYRHRIIVRNSISRFFMSNIIACQIVLNHSWYCFWTSINVSNLVHHRLSTSAASNSNKKLIEITFIEVSLTSHR